MKNHNVLSSFIKNINAIKNLRKNKELLKIYEHNQSSLYFLHNNRFIDPKVQEDYNKLPKEYKYHNILWNGIPFSILFIKPSLIKYISLK